MTLSKMILCLPGEEEIETAVEKRVSESSCLIERTIRYRNGTQVRLIQDLMGQVFHFSIKCSDRPMWISENHLLRTTN